MFNPIFTDPNNALLRDRLTRISEELRNIKLSTSEEYQAAVYSAVNAVLSLGLSMTPLQPVSAESPAVLGDVVDNYTILNNDAQDIANELLRIEDAAASFFNLSATSQNQLRQQIREFVFASSKDTYIEGFLNTASIKSTTANLDFNAGLATNALLNETIITPIFSIGPSSSGNLDTDTLIDNLNDGRIDTNFVWNGEILELILSFSSPQIMNRISINLDIYEGLDISSFTTSPDGTLVEDILLDIGVSKLRLDGTSNKFSGDVVIDFPPRHVKTARLVISDITGNSLISLREIICYSRRYSSTGQLTSNSISAPTGNVRFSVIQNVFAPYTSITHQISYDGTQFIAITPGDVVLSKSPFFYRALFERSTARFNQPSNPVKQSPLDSVSSVNYSLVGTSTIPLGNGIIERSLQVNSVTGPITLRENIIPNTLVIQEGSIILNPDQGDYVFTNNVISFSELVTGIIISYQTTSLGSAAIKDREEYYTPFLYEVKFETK